jgi:metal-responsive CopG/Arc/MetJ family transcriptional regulator
MPVAYRKPVTISLPPPLLKDVERLAKKQHQTTSELVREALRRYLSEAWERAAAWKRARAYGAKKAKTLGLHTEEDVYRLIDELRHGAATPPAAASRRR